MAGEILGDVVPYLLAICPRHRISPDVKNIAQTREGRQEHVIESLTYPSHLCGSNGCELASPRKV